MVALAENFATPSDPTVASGAIKNADENRQRVITGGAFGTLLMGFKDRYFVTVGGRLDGNSAFGSDFGFQFYPKINGSWVLSDESFWQEKYGTLKLRGTHFGIADGVLRVLDEVSGRFEAVAVD